MIIPLRSLCLTMALLPSCAFFGGGTSTDLASARLVVTVKFRSQFDEAEVRRRYPERMPRFRALPGLVQKVYLYDAAAGEWAGFYFWSSQEAVAAYLASDLRKSIPTAYGVVGQPRVESYQLIDVLR